MIRPMRARLPVRGEPMLALVVVLAGCWYAGFAVLRHEHYASGFDLGLFNQAVWHLSRLDAPAVTAKGLGNLWGDHFHPLISVLAPLYWVRADATTLLVAQGALLAASIVPVFLFARDRLGRLPAYGFAVAYAGFWAIQSGAGFEFHELAFAPLLVGLAILWGDREQWGRFYFALALLLLVKEDMGILVAFFGVWLLTRREWRRGAAVAIAGIGAYYLTTKVLIPEFGDGRDFAYWSYDGIGSDLPDALGNLVTEPWLLPETLFDDGEKARTIAYLFLPFLCLTFGSRIAVLAIPLLAERFLSSNPIYWDTSFHYSLTIAPVVAMGAAAGLANVAGRLVPESRRALAIGAAAVVIVAANAVANHYGARTIPQLRDFDDSPPFAAAVDGALARLPDDASVATQDTILPHVSARATAALIAPSQPRTDYVIAGLAEPVGNPTLNRSYRALQRELLARLPAYAVEYYREGWVLLRPRRGGEDRGVMTPLAPRDAARLRRAARGGPAGVDHELDRAIAAATGACRDLGKRTRAGLTDYRRALVTNDPAATSRARDDEDLPGRLDRFVALCAPR
jgi:uncharacterized membrane protein